MMELDQDFDKLCVVNVVILYNWEFHFCCMLWQQHSVSFWRPSGDLLETFWPLRSNVEH